MKFFILNIENNMIVRKGLICFLERDVIDIFIYILYFILFKFFLKRIK